MRAQLPSSVRSLEFWKCVACPACFNSPGMIIYIYILRMRLFLRPEHNHVACGVSWNRKFNCENLPYDATMPNKISMVKICDIIFLRSPLFWKIEKWKGLKELNFSRYSTTQDTVTHFGNWGGPNHIVFTNIGLCISLRQEETSYKYWYFPSLWLMLNKVSV